MPTNATKHAVQNTHINTTKHAILNTQKYIEIQKLA